MVQKVKSACSIVVESSLFHVYYYKLLESKDQVYVTSALTDPPSCFCVKLISQLCWGPVHTQLLNLHTSLLRGGNGRLGKWRGGGGWYSGGGHGTEKPKVPLDSSYESLISKSTVPTQTGARDLKFTLTTYLIPLEAEVGMLTHLLPISEPTR